MSEKGEQYGLDNLKKKIEKGTAESYKTINSARKGYQMLLLVLSGGNMWFNGKVTHSEYVEIVTAHNAQLTFGAFYHQITLRPRAQKDKQGLYGICVDNEKIKIYYRKSECIREILIFLEFKLTGSLNINRQEWVRDIPEGRLFTIRVFLHPFKKTLLLRSLLLAQIGFKIEQSVRLRYIAEFSNLQQLLRAKSCSGHRFGSIYSTVKVSLKYFKCVVKFRFNLFKMENTHFGSGIVFFPQILLSLFSARGCGHVSEYFGS